MKGRHPVKTEGPACRLRSSRGSAARLPQRQVLTDEVYETLKGMIMDSEIAAGARVNIDALARELRVSQTPIRESLARLESDGLVTKAALRGYSVSRS